MSPPLLPDPESSHIAPVTAHDAVRATAANVELTNAHAQEDNNNKSNSNNNNISDDGDGVVGNRLPEGEAQQAEAQVQELPAAANVALEAESVPLAAGLRYRAHGALPDTYFTSATSSSAYRAPSLSTAGPATAMAAPGVPYPASVGSVEESHYAQRYYNSNNPNDAATMPQVVRDSFGNARYERVNNNNGSSSSTGAGQHGQPGSSVSWSAAMAAVTAEQWPTHSVGGTAAQHYFKFLFAPLFWFLLQYAARVTFIAMLVPAAIIHANVHPRPFISDTFVLSGVIVGAGVHFGQSASFCVQFVKAGFIWLPIVLVCIAIHLDRHHVAWFVVYTVVLFLMATFTDRTTRRMCLLLFNITMVALLSGNTSLLYPVRVLADWAIGAGFALVATLLPYPLLATRLSEAVTRKMCTNTATCFQGILLCLWAPSNTERTMSMVRMRSYIWLLDQLVDRFDAYDVYTFYEVLLFDTSERREVRKEKVKLLLNLKMNLRSMVRVINILQERPQMLDQSDRCLLCRNHLTEPLDKVTRCIHDLCEALSKARNYADLHNALPFFEATGHAVKVLQDEFNMAQRVLFYESFESNNNNNNINNNIAALPADRMEEFIPLLTFLVFSVVNFWASLREFQLFITHHDSRHSARNTLLLILRAVVEPFTDNARLVQLLCTRRGKPEMRVVIEAAKVSLAMFVAVLFFYFVNDRALLLSGPTTIAFVSGTNPVEAVQASAARLSGTLVGSVLGYFTASLCSTGVDRILAICIITFFLTLPRPAHSFGVVCSYCNFIIISNLGRTRQTSVDALSRIQQNTFAVLIYCVISITVYPLSPSRVLMQKRTAVLQGVNFAVRRLVSLMYEAADGYAALPPRNAESHEQEEEEVVGGNGRTVHAVHHTVPPGGITNDNGNVVVIGSSSSQDAGQMKPPGTVPHGQAMVSNYTATTTTPSTATPCNSIAAPPPAVCVGQNVTPKTLAAEQQPAQRCSPFPERGSNNHHQRRRHPRTRLIPIHTSHPPKAQTDAEEEMQMVFQSLTGGADEPLYRFPGVRTGLAHATTLVTLRPCAQNRLLVRPSTTNTTSLTSSTNGTSDASSSSTSIASNNNEPVTHNASSLHPPGSTQPSIRNSTLIPFTFTMPEEQDRAIEEIMTVLASMLNWMKETTHVMPLASDELHIIPRTYPTRSCMDVHAALYRLCALVYTMACSWKQMRGKGYFTEEVGHILTNLVPVAADIAACLDHFMQLFVVYVRDPSAELGNELTWRVMQLRALCAELSLRKERDILATIRKTVQEQGFYGKGTSSGNNTPLRFSNRPGGGAGAAAATNTTAYTQVPPIGQPPQPPLAASSVQWSARSGGAARSHTTPINASEVHHEPESFLSFVPLAAASASATTGLPPPHELSTTRPGLHGDGSASGSPVRRNTQLPHTQQQQEAEEEEEGDEHGHVTVQVSHSDPLTRQPSDVPVLYDRNSNAEDDDDDDDGEGPMTTAMMTTMMDEPNATQRSQSRLVSNGTRIFSDRTGLTTNYSVAAMTQEGNEPIANTPRQSMHVASSTVHADPTTAMTATNTTSPVSMPRLEQSRSPSMLTRHSASPLEVEFDASVLTHAEQLRAELRRNRRQRTQSIISSSSTAGGGGGGHTSAGLGMPCSSGSTASLATASSAQNECGNTGRSPFAPAALLSSQPSTSPEQTVLTYSQASAGNHEYSNIINNNNNVNGGAANVLPSVFVQSNNNNNNYTNNTMASDAQADPLSVQPSSVPLAAFAASDEVDNYANRSLIRFADSFTIPVTVLDTEGLHAFTLSLEMLGKELRRVLYGMEEMLQSKLMQL